MSNSGIVRVVITDTNIERPRRRSKDNSQKTYDKQEEPGDIFEYGPRFFA